VDEGALRQLNVLITRAKSIAYRMITKRIRTNAGLPLPSEVDRRDAYTMVPAASTMRGMYETC
jgi:hypothetical protein